MPRLFDVRSTFLLFAALSALALPACGSDEASPDTESGNAPTTPSEQTPADPTDPVPDVPDVPDDPTTTTAEHLKACHAPETWGGDAFSQGVLFEAELDDPSYTLAASHTLDGGFIQEISIEIYPSDPSAAQTGTFDLSKEGFSYATCEHCVLLYAWNGEQQRKIYLAQSGTLTMSELAGDRIRGSLAGVTFAEVDIEEDSWATTRVEGGCTSTLPRFEFAVAPPALDPHIEQCFVPERFLQTSFSDFIYGLTEYDGNLFYRAMEIPVAGSGMPSMTLFIEAYETGTGSFDLAGAETNCPTCMHLVIVEAQMPNGKMKKYVSASGTLTLDRLDAEVMRGSLKDVRLVETDITGSTFTPVPDGCETRIDFLPFSSENETALSGD